MMWKMKSHNQGRSRDFFQKVRTSFQIPLPPSHHLPLHNNVFTLYSVLIYLLILDSSLVIVYCYFFLPPTFSGTHMLTVRTGSYATDNCLQQKCLISKTCACYIDLWTARSLPFHLLSCFSLFLDLFGQLESNTVTNVKHWISLLNATNVEQR